MSDLPRPVVLAAFRRGMMPSQIAASFGVEDGREVVDELIAAMREEGASDEEIAEAFGSVWLDPQANT